MIIKKKKLTQALQFPLHETIAKEKNIELKKEDLVFFDIETTGFSPNNTILYLIGCAYYKEDTWNLIQWFSDDNTSEKNILHAFFDFIQNYKVLIHFNGDGFDIPYIEKKCAKLGLTYDFSSILSYDIYKNMLPFKKLFKLSNFKQKTIEQFLNIPREDLYSGGQLIQIYANYLGIKKLEQLKNRSHEISPIKNLEKRMQSNVTPTSGLPMSDELLGILLLHNANDVEGMLSICDILIYKTLLTSDYHAIHAELLQDFLAIHFTVPYILPQPISYGNDICYLSANKDQALLKVPLYKNELKFFYDNYKDYYYLPNEDTAIHKSVAFYVDKNFRTRAKAANCYSKKTGSFVIQFDEIYTPHFKIDYHDKFTYVETTKEFLEDTDKLTLYLNHMIKTILKYK